MTLLAVLLAVFLTGILTGAFLVYCKIIRTFTR